MKKVRFSVVIPVYNRENFICDAVESVLAQTYGRENIELILVDDGSKDNSPAICDDYAKRYPDTIKVIHKENGGASSARNVGVKAATGDFINFLDSDDKLSDDTMASVAKFIKKYKEKTDVIALPIYFFGLNEGKHFLNYKFDKGTRLIDLQQEWTAVQMSLSASFVRTSVAKKYAFDQDLHIATGEDSREVLHCLMAKQTLGVVSKAKYWYRKHEQDSLITDAGEKKTQYEDNLNGFHREVIDFYKENLGYIPKYLQYTIIYDIQFRLKRDSIPDTVLSAAECASYKENLLSLVCMMDDDIIARQRHLFTESRTFLLYQKYKRYPQLTDNENGEAIFCYEDKEHPVVNVENIPIRLSLLQIDDRKISIFGKVFKYLYMCPQEINYYVQIDDEVHPLSLKGPYRTTRFLETPLMEEYHFQFDVSIFDKKKTSIKFWIEIGQKRVEIQNLLMDAHFPLDRYNRFSYHCEKGIMLFQKNNVLCIKRKKHAELWREIRYTASLLLSSKRGAKKAALVRSLYLFLRMFRRKPIWLVMDRVDQADDNGEVFFRYLMEKAKDSELPADVYFVLDHRSKDYKRLCEIGPVIDVFSFRHKFLYLFAEFYISSQADNVSINPYRGYRDVYKATHTPKFVFLQHGIIMNDLAGWLGRYGKNIFGFITSTDDERKFIAEQFEYPEDSVWLTGMPRFDRLTDQDEKIITIMPTWRKKLLKTVDAKTGRRKLVPKVKESEFFQFYNELLNDAELEKVAKQYGYQICFKSHPALKEMVSLFDRKTDYAIWDDAPYRDIYAKSSMIITDYSSAVFDFAYLKKPILYAQFDRESFFGGEHTLKEGYFDYKRDGLGEVTEDLAETRERIIEYIKSGCVLKEEYENRINHFFAYRDQNNCERIYKKIIENR